MLVGWLVGFGGESKSEGGVEGTRERGRKLAFPDCTSDGASVQALSLFCWALMHVRFSPRGVHPSPIATGACGCAWLPSRHAPWSPSSAPAWSCPCPTLAGPGAQQAPPSWDTVRAVPAEGTGPGKAPLPPAATCWSGWWTARWLFPATACVWCLAQGPCQGPGCCHSWCPWMWGATRGDANPSPVIERTVRGKRRLMVVVVGGGGGSRRWNLHE